MDRAEARGGGQYDPQPRTSHTQNRKELVKLICKQSLFAVALVGVLAFATIAQAQTAP
jgi:hypothetical protein